MDGREKSLTSRSTQLLTDNNNTRRTPSLHSRIPESIKFFKTHKQNTQPIQCHYAVSKEYINSVPTDTHVESPHFPIYLQIKDNYIKIQLEKNLYLPVSYYDSKTKAQLLDNVHQKQQLKQKYSPAEIYPIIQHTDVTLNTNKTEPLQEFNHDANYAELINTLKFSIPAMDDFIPNSPTIYNYFYERKYRIKRNTSLRNPTTRPSKQTTFTLEKYKIPPPPAPHHKRSELTKVYYIIIADFTT